jgi:hypothetical protein
VNRKPAPVHGLEDVHVNRVACGSSHSIAWTTFNTQLPNMHEPVLFVSSNDPLGASTLGNSICAFFLMFFVVVLCNLFVSLSYLIYILSDRKNKY